jgi:hypothetical protein
VNYLTGVLDFLLIGKQLDELYEFLKKVKGDIKEFNQEFSNKEIKQLLTDFKKGVADTDIICIKIIKADEVENKMFGKPLDISQKEREDIAYKIGQIATELQKIAETPAVTNFIKERPELSNKIFYIIDLRSSFKAAWFQKVDILNNIVKEDFRKRMISRNNDNPTFDSEHSLQILFLQHLKDLDKRSVEMINVLNKTIDSL